LDGSPTGLEYEQYRDQEHGFRNITHSPSFSPVILTAGRPNEIPTVQETVARTP